MSFVPDRPRQVLWFNCVGFQNPKDDFDKLTSPGVSLQRSAVRDVPALYGVGRSSEGDVKINVEVRHPPAIAQVSMLRNIS